MAFTEDHEGIHGTADVVLFPLVKVWQRTRVFIVVTFNKQSPSGVLLLFFTSCLLVDWVNSGLTFLSPSLGSALRDCVRLLMVPVEGDGSLAKPGENLHPHKKKSETETLTETGIQGRFLSLRLYPLSGRFYHSFPKNNIHPRMIALTGSRVTLKILQEKNSKERPEIPL